MPSYAVHQAYTRWAIADLRYQQARQQSQESAPTGEDKERMANQLASLAKAAKDAWDAHQRAIQAARDEEAGFF